MQARQGPEADGLHALPERGILHSQQGHVALHADGQHRGNVLAVVTSPLDLDLRLRGSRLPRSKAARTGQQPAA